jgi:hypothetical protein
MGNSKSTSYKDAIIAIKELKIDDFNNIDIFNGGCLLFPIKGMSLFLLKRCLHDELIDNPDVYKQTTKFYIFVRTIDGHNFIQASLQPYDQCLEMWLDFNLRKDGKLDIHLNQLGHIYFGRAEMELIKVCQKNNWCCKITKTKTDKDLQIDIHIKGELI